MSNTPGQPSQTSHVNAFVKLPEETPAVEPPAWYYQAVSTLCTGFIFFTAQAIFSPPKDEILVPPRAQRFSDEVVTAWKRNQLFRIAARRTMQRTLLSGLVGVAYFGTEAGASYLRDGAEDALNTAAGGAITGAFLACLMPGMLRGRMVALGAAAGGLLGYGTGSLKQFIPQPEKHHSGATAGEQPSSADDS